jgi:endonuclease/exonuclease/phosphatase family metal-dependent hydrolase
MSLHLISLNIERDKHFERFAPFFEREKPDVACLQEVFERDVPRLAELLGAAEYLFAPMTRYPVGNGHEPMGPAIFSRFPMRAPQVRYYRGDPSVIHAWDTSTIHTKNATEHHLLAYADIEKDGGTYRIGNTHFTWTADGEADDYQREDLAKLLPLLEEAGELAFMGDFNAPRGKEIFQELAKRYASNVPETYGTSLDKDLHRAGFLPYVVDHLFTTASYRAENVRLVSGVSDHCAIVADLSLSSTLRP